MCSLLICKVATTSYKWPDTLLTQIYTEYSVSLENLELLKKPALLEVTGFLLEPIIRLERMTC